jgi:hypothetical protein
MRSSSWAERPLMTGTAVSQGGGPWLDRIAAAAFVLGLLAIAFGYGFLAGSKQLWPHDQVGRLEEAAEAFYKVYLQPEARASTELALPARDDRAGAIMHDAARTQPGDTFLTLYTADGFEGRLIGLDGKVLHAWHARYSEVFPDHPQLMWKAPDKFIVWHGAHLFPNGDMLFNFQDKSFPYGGGLVKLDKNSRVLWKVAANTHHDIVVAEDGTIWAPSQHYVPDGLKETLNLKPWYYEDTVLHVSPDGQVLGEVSVLRALASWPGLLSLNYEEKLAVAANDPLHVNSAEPLSPSLAAKFPLFAAGDLLVSLRNINTLVVIDPATDRVKWALTGPFAKQHDARWLPDGRIRVYDNKGGDPKCGGSRVLEIDPATQAVSWAYDACGDHPFANDIRGIVQALPNGNLLVTEALGGRAFEVARDDKRIVWEYVNAIDTGAGARRVGLVTHAERFPVDALSFLTGAEASTVGDASR